MKNAKDLFIAIFKIMFNLLVIFGFIMLIIYIIKK